MKANEFVKKFGLDTARNVTKINNGFLYFEVINNIPCYSNHYYADCNQVSLEDLKRLVESHELMEKHGCLLRAKSHYEKYKAMGSESNIILFSAIAGVESCL